MRGERTEQLVWLMKFAGDTRYSIEGGSEVGKLRSSALAPCRSPLGTRIAEGKRERATHPERECVSGRTRKASLYRAASEMLVNRAAGLASKNATDDIIVL